MNGPRHIHASCVARDGAGVLLLGPPGSGKSDLALRLLSRGFVLVGDDQVVIQGNVARPASSLAGLLEVRGLGIVRLPHAAETTVVLAVELVTVGRSGGATDPSPKKEKDSASRLPEPRRHPELGLPLIVMDSFAPSAPERVALALDCATGRIQQVAGAFAA